MNTDIKKWALEAFAARMGQGKNKNSASRLDRFLLFSANPSRLGSSVPIWDIRGYVLSNRAPPVVGSKITRRSGDRSRSHPQVCRVRNRGPIRDFSGMRDRTSRWIAWRYHRLAPASCVISGMTKNPKLPGGFPRERFQFPSAALQSSFVL